MVVRSGREVRTGAGRAGVGALLLATAVGCGGSEGGGGTGAGGGGEGGGDVFEGETINFIVPFDPGGGYDTYTRTIAPYLGDCLGARMVVQNEPGAGSLVATSKTAVSEPDGTRIQIMNMPGVVASQLAGAEGVNFDLSEFSWIGRIAAPAEVVLGGEKFAEFGDLAEASDSVQFVATGPGASDFIGATVLARAYELEHEIATGFAGSGEATNAVVSGEADVHVMPYDSVLSVIEAGDATPLVLFEEERPEYMPEDVPLIGEVEPQPSEEGAALIENFMQVTEAGRSVTAPPGMPEDRLTALREGFACAMEDEELLGELESQQRPVGFVPGDEYEQIVEDALNPSEEFQQLLKESF